MTPSLLSDQNSSVSQSLDALGVWIVNLADCHRRLAQVTEELERADLPFQRVQAVDGRGVLATSFPEYHNQLALRRYGRPLSGSEMGCFLSHRRCAQQFLSSNAQLALVLEDDVRIPADFRLLLGRLLSWLEEHYQNQWDVLNLGNPSHKFSRQLAEFRIPLGTGNSTNQLDSSACVASCNSYRLMAAHYFPLGTFAVLWNRRGAQAFLDSTQSIYAPVDQFLRDWCARTGRGLAVDPAPIGVDRSQSFIRHRLRDRLSHNLLHYWAVKNLRLIRNQFAARQKWLTDFPPVTIGTGPCNATPQTQCYLPTASSLQLQGQDRIASAITVDSARSRQSA
ncbi:MAG: glycosyltransferase family 25 protein [Pirellulaceae bacterium]|nr:glycosyltransferase family 25 protein [Pirellulaceae bacterium]